MKVFSLSQRFYYKDLDIEDVCVIKKDLVLYNSMLHKAFKRCYDHAFKDAKYDESDQKFIKSFYGTSDYLPLSAIYEAKALIKSITLKENLYKKQIECRIQSMDKKIKNKKYTESNYLYEVQVLDSKIKRLKNNIKMLQYRKKLMLPHGWKRSEHIKKRCVTFHRKVFSCLYGDKYEQAF